MVLQTACLCAAIVVFVVLSILETQRDRKIREMRSRMAVKYRHHGSSKARTVGENRPFEENWF